MVGMEIRIFINPLKQRKSNIMISTMLLIYSIFLHIIIIY